METQKQLDAYISAFIDGELPAHDAGLALAALGEPGGALAWRAYHLIGDVLRSDASGAELGEGFESRLKARLDVEVAPAAASAAAMAPPVSAPAQAAPLPEAADAVPVLSAASPEN